MRAAVAKRLYTHRPNQGSANNFGTTLKNSFQFARPKHSRAHNFVENFLQFNIKTTIDSSNFHNFHAQYYMELSA